MGDHTPNDKQQRPDASPFSKYCQNALSPIRLGAGLFGSSPGPAPSHADDMSAPTFDIAKVTRGRSIQKIDFSKYLDQSFNSGKLKIQVKLAKSAEEVKVTKTGWNCPKNRCLQLYCQCFKNQEYCDDCACQNCRNNEQHAKERQKAIELILAKNPDAFAKVEKGCNCTESECNKRYCSCFAQGTLCTESCNCTTCYNREKRPRQELECVELISKKFKINPDN